MSTKDILKKYKKKNVRQTKKNPLKRLNKFGVFLVTYTGILVAGVLILLIFLYGLLKDYEKGMPAHTMDKLVKEFTPDNIENVLNNNGVTVNEFETIQVITDYYKNILQNGSVSYKKKAGEFTSENPVYTVFAGDKSIAKVKLEENGKNGHNFPNWKVGNISVQGFIDAGAEVTITAPTGAEVKLNGIKVNDNYITKKDVTFDPVKRVNAFVTTPTEVIYKVSGLMAQPNVTATMNGANLDVKSDGKEITISYPSDQAMLDSQKSLITDVYRSYGRYIINKGSLTEVTKNCIGSAKTLLSDIPSVWAFLYGKSYSYEFRNEKISNCIKYSDNCFSVRVDYDLYVKWNEGEKTYPTNLVYTFVKSSNSWYLADFAFVY